LDLRPSDLIGDGLSEFREHSPVSDAEVWSRRLWRDLIRSNAVPPTVGHFYDTLTSWDASTPGDYVQTAANLTVTAGNAPGLNDGAAALVLMSRQAAEAQGLKPLARIVAAAPASAAPRLINVVPALAAQNALRKATLDVGDIDLWEINEAFAAVTLTAIKILGVDPELVNVNGGSVAIGHPVGATGARILMTLIYELRRRGGGLGLATICGAGAHGYAMIVEVTER